MSSSNLQLIAYMACMGCKQSNDSLLILGENLLIYMLNSNLAALRFETGGTNKNVNIMIQHSAVVHLFEVSEIQLCDLDTEATA